MKRLPAIGEKLMYADSGNRIYGVVSRYIPCPPQHAYVMLRLESTGEEKAISITRLSRDLREKK